MNLKKREPQYQVGNVVRIKGRSAEQPVRIEEVHITYAGILYDAHAVFDEEEKGSFAEEQVLGHYLGAI